MNFIVFFVFFDHELPRGVGVIDDPFRMGVAEHVMLGSGKHEHQHAVTDIQSISQPNIFFWMGFIDFKMR